MSNVEQVRRLIEHRGRYRVISLYLDLDPEQFATPPARASQIRSVLDEAARDVEGLDGLAHEDKVALREDLNRRAARVLAVLRPLKLVIENYPVGRSEELDAINHPDDSAAGIRRIPFGRELYIERDDFTENPPRNFHRLGLDFESSGMGRTGVWGPPPGSYTGPPTDFTYPKGITRTVVLTGADLYRLDCRPCHKADGNGEPPEIAAVSGPVQAMSATLMERRMKERGRPISAASASRSRDAGRPPTSP